MAHIISTIFAYLGFLVTGYDFFILLTLISLSINIYMSLMRSIKKLKRYLIYAKDKTAKWQICTSDKPGNYHLPCNLQIKLFINRPPSFHSTLIHTICRIKQYTLSVISISNILVFFNLSRHFEILFQFLQILYIFFHFSTNISSINVQFPKCSYYFNKKGTLLPSDHPFITYVKEKLRGYSFHLSMIL